MIVFDQHGVVETEAVIAPAAARDGVSLERAQTGRRLARVRDARARAGDADRRAAASRLRCRKDGRED